MADGFVLLGMSQEVSSRLGSVGYNPSISFPISNYRLQSTYLHSKWLIFVYIFIICWTWRKESTIKFRLLDWRFDGAGIPSWMEMNRRTRRIAFPGQQWF